MANNIVEILLRGNTSSLKGDMSKAQSIVDSATRGIASRVTSMLSVATFVVAARDAMQFGDELSKASEKLGISVEKLSALNYAAGLSDISLESLQKSMKFLSKAVTDSAVSSSDAAIAFRAMGLSTKDASGNIRPLNDMFSLVADKFSAMEDGAGKVSLAVALFGRAGMDMIPLLNKSAGGIAELEREAGRLGATVSGKTAKSLEEANDNLKSFWMTVKGTAASISGALIGAVDSLGDAFGESLSHTDASKFFFGPNAVKFPAPPLPPKIAAPNIDAIKKGMEDRKKLLDDYQKLHAKNLADEGKEVHDALAEEMGWSQEYFDTLSKMRVDDFNEWKKVQEDEANLLEKFELDKIAALKDLQDAQREELEITEKIAEYRAEDAFAAAMQYGDSANAVQLLNAGLSEQFRIMDEGREKVAALQGLYSTVFRGKDGVVADMADTAVKAFNSMTDALTNFVMTGKMQFRDFANSVISDLARIAIQQSVTRPLFAGITSFAGSLFGGGMASGGPVSGGTAYLVGERGPEMFIPSTAGSIVPNGGGKQSVSVEIHNDSGIPMKVTKSNAFFDAQETVVTLWVDALQHNKLGLRDMLGGA